MNREERIVIGKFTSKAWGKSPVLHCTFESSTGVKEVFGCFKPRNGKISGVYTAQDGLINFNDENILGCWFELNIKKTKKGREYLYSAKEIETKE
ncbi:hypothetical protein [Aliivibrio fischeri]|uniref:hypothetical protein n=1 Tax=Aliivibrio fischeri TaxID=668 RepID=UPI0012D93596|nr:hypothetical protein [Aliivibrio fischeri]MUJ20458.1 hypothetical protein [Aliivibrio fischeri]